MKLRVEANRSITIILPKGLDEKTGLAFARQEQSWLCENLSKIENPIAFAPGEIIPILGQSYRLVHTPEARGVVSVQGDDIHICGQEAHVARRFEDWAKNQIRIKVCNKVEQFTEKLDVTFGRVSIRDQKSRWGSCSSAGNLNFSWRLIFMPESVVDYIIAHEVAHLVHLNHSREFWAVNKYLCPDLEKSKRWLRENGAFVHKYGATK